MRLLWLIFLCAVAQAEIESPLVRAGLGAFDKGELPRAVELLTRALGESLTREEKSATLSTLAQSLDALGRHDEARQRFSELSRLLPGVETARPLFDPAQPKDGQSVRVTLEHPGGLASRAQLFHRSGDARGFSQLEIRGDGGRFTAVIPDLHAPALELYGLILDDRGLPIAHTGSLGRPLSLGVQAPKRPVYRRAWFWGVLGGSAAAIVIVGLAAGLAATEKPVHLVVQPE